MKTKITILTKEERDTLTLAALHPDGKFLSNSEIGQLLGMSVNRVKTIMYQAYIKLGARNRNEAIILALKQREIILTDFYSLDELAEVFSSLGPDILRMMANAVRQGLEYVQLPEMDGQTFPMCRRQGGKLTNNEQNVVMLAGAYGLTNKEIADRLRISVGSVRIFLNRAFIKLGARKRADAFLLAIKQREIDAIEFSSYNEWLELLAPLGAESIERLSQLVDQKLGQEPMLTSS